MKLVLQWGRSERLMSQARSVVVVSLALLAIPIVAGAQHVHTLAESPAGGGRVTVPAPSWHRLSAKAREQIQAVERAVAGLAAQDSVRAAGFRPVFGMIPTMGVHWVGMNRVLDTVKLLEPAQLLFSKVDGKPRLMGVAYAFLGAAANAPDLFDGDQDVWHDHPELAPPGMSVVMLHVWFVPSPDGPFAGHNPWLPYWAAGVEPPADSVMAEPESAARARRLALALAAATESVDMAQLRSGQTPLAIAIAQVQANGQAQVGDSTMPPGVEARRDSLRTLIPRLNAARSAGNGPLWNQEADAAIALWRQVRDAYYEATPPGELRDRVAALYKEMEAGGHTH